MRSWIKNGTEHTFIQRDVTATAGGVSVQDWLTAFLADSPECSTARDD